MSWYMVLSFLHIITLSSKASLGCARKCGLGGGGGSGVEFPLQLGSSPQLEAIFVQGLGFRVQGLGFRV